MRRKFLFIALFFFLLILSLGIVLYTEINDNPSTRRSKAVRMLISGDPGDNESESYSLSAIVRLIRNPVLRGGSINNLYHFLSRDPGRRQFVRYVDRRHAQSYMSGELLEQAKINQAAYRLVQNQDNRFQEWVPGYLGMVTALFDKIKTDLVGLSGYPPELLDMNVKLSDDESALLLQQKSIAEFSQNWIPSSNSSVNCSINRAQVRSFLNRNLRFRSRMRGINSAWADLLAELYMLPQNGNWILAASYEPRLNTELAELTIAVQAADLYSGKQDLLSLVRCPDMFPSVQSDAGITRTPDLVYYKNIPEVTGQTSDTPREYFQARVSLGYTFRDNRTQTWLNQRRDWLTDFFVRFFSNTVKDDFSFYGEQDPDIIAWKNASLKASALYSINIPLSQNFEFGKHKVHGVRDLAFVEINLLGSF